MVKTTQWFWRNPGGKWLIWPGNVPEYDDQTLKAIEEGKRLIEWWDGKEGIKILLNEAKKLEEVKSILQEEIEEKKGILITWLEEEKQRLEENIWALIEEAKSHQDREDKFNNLMKVKYAVAIIVGWILWYTWWQTGAYFHESEWEQQIRLDTEKRVSEAIRSKIIELWWKVDHPLEIDGAVFSRKNKTTAFNEREFSVEDYFYTLEGQYNWYDVTLSFPFINAGNIIVVQFWREKTSLTNPSLEDLEKFLRRKLEAFELKKTQEAVEKAQKEAEELEKERIEEARREALEMEAAAKAKAEEVEKKRLEDEKIAAEKAAIDKIEADRIANIEARKKWVTNVIKKLSGNNEYELGDDFVIKVELAKETLELYFAPERRLWSLRDDNEWQIDEQTLKLYLDPVKSGILGKKISDLSKYGKPTNESHIEISVQEPHKMHVHMIYSYKEDYEEHWFDTQDLRDFWKDIVVELQWEAELNERKEAKISQNKQAVLEVLRKLSGNDSLNINDSFDIVTTDGKDEIKISLEPLRWNGNLPTNNHWLRSGRNYILKWVNRRSNTLRMYKFEDFYLYIDLKAPYNISYKAKMESHNIQEQSWYSSTNLTQVLGDIYEYFSYNAEVK